jgi:predicted GTPase
MVTDRKTETAPDPAPSQRQAGEKKVIVVLNSLIGLLGVAVVYLIAVYFIPELQQKETDLTGGAQLPVVQIDVRNGCGVPGCAARITDLLRRRGFDVVEVKNYGSFDIPNTMIIDRVDDQVSAERVASALGVDRCNIVRQFNNDYFVHVTVVVGKDYSTLKPSPIKIPKEKD